jgi:hypothetical protein
VIYEAEDNGVHSIKESNSKRPLFARALCAGSEVT